MQRTQLSACAFAVAGMLTASAFGQSNNGQQQTQHDRQSQQQQQKDQQQQYGQSQQRGGQANQAPDGFVLVDERVIMLTANEPQSHFVRAAGYIEHNDTRAAAAEVRIAAAYLDMQASRAKKSGGDQELTQAADRLRKVADELHPRQNQQKQGDQKEQAQGQQQQKGQLGQQLTRAFAEADQALAHHFQSEAQREIGSHRAVMAGHDLDAAASSLMAAVAWSGQKPSQDVTSACQDAQRVAAELLAPHWQGQASASGGQAQQSNTDKAQPAAAQIGSSSQGQGQQASSGNAGRIPDDAKKVVDQLGSAIQKVGSQTQNGGNSSPSSGGSASGGNSSGGNSSGQSGSGSGHGK